jgi:hypothetical protein
MSKKIYLHMVKSGMIKEERTAKTKDKRISQKPHIKYNLTRYTK